MAQQIQIVLIDDIDGGPAQETITFGLDGTTYEIDLSADNADRLRKALVTYTGHARKVSARKAAGPRPSAGRTSNRTDRSSQIREWARSQGIAVNERGRVPAELAARFDAAHPAQAAPPAPPPASFHSAADQAGSAPDNHA